MGIRLRYAPSPTGSLHLGGLRTALYNYVMARQSGGALVLRIEDTDQRRTVPGSAESMLTTFNRLGLQFDEGPGIGGAYAPYTQSERLARYQAHIDSLVERGHGYHCFCTPERLDLVRKMRAKEGLSSMYDGLCRSLDEREVGKRLDDNLPHVIRLNPPADGVTTFRDLVRGQISIENKLIDHQVLRKSDGFPTYHLASVVDDHLSNSDQRPIPNLSSHTLPSVEITHVVRGEEWLSSTPKHVILYNAFQWDTPIFAHLPLLLTTARAKLSKRHQHSSVEHLLDAGFLPSAIIHFAATMGWNPSSNQSVEGPMTMGDLIEHFEVGRIQKGGAQVDLQRLKWLSGHHFRAQFANDPQSTAQMVRSYSPESFKDVSESFLQRIIAVVAERVSVLADVILFGRGLFRQPEPRLQDLLQLGVSLQELDQILLQLPSTTMSQIDAGNVSLPALRYILYGERAGPPISAILTALGPFRSLLRIQKARRVLSRPGDALNSTNRLSIK